MAKLGIVWPVDAVSGPARGEGVAKGPTEPTPCPPVVRLMDCYGERGFAPDVLVFGDSTSLFVSHLDLRRRNLLKMETGGLAPLRTCTLAHAQYCAPVHAALLAALAALPRRPRVILLPVNVRQFGPQWAANPNLQFTSLIAAARGFAIKPSGGVPITGNFFRGLSRVDAPHPDETDLWEQYMDAVVTFPDGERTMREFASLIASKVTDERSLEERIRAIFAVHYLFPLALETNARLQALAEAVSTATGLGIDVVAHVTPVNHETGTRLLGDIFTAALNEHLATIERTCAQAARAPGTVHFVDTSQVLRSGEFFSTYEVLGHINEWGRAVYAPHLVRAGRDAATQKTPSGVGRVRTE